MHFVMIDAMEVCKMNEYVTGKIIKELREKFHFTQAELAERSGVSLRSIQMYEQRNKDINKASAETLYRIAMALGCAMEDLIER